MNGRDAKSGLAAAGAALVLMCALAFSAGAVSAHAAEQQGVAGLSREEAMRLGERIYRKGMLPSGDPVTALVQGDIPVEGTMFSCESCHMRSGLGSYEGGVWTTATTGKYLFNPITTLRRLSPSEVERIPAYLRPMYDGPPRRPAYTDETLAAALRDGIDPAGRIFHSVMPRYSLDDRDMAILVFYLKSLSAEFSPGVTDTTLSFATIITDDVSPEERDAMLGPLENYVGARNSQARKFETRAKYGIFAERMDLAYRRLSLARWELKGPPETWRGQLEEYYRKEPVFALLGGITNGEWRPIHEFSEEHRIPCIFPVTDFPVISDTDWYTLYFSRGLSQEGETVARYLAITANLDPDKTVVQVFRDTREGHVLSDGFQNTWQSFGRRAPRNIMLREDEPFTGELLAKLAKGEKPAVLLLWIGTEAVQALETGAVSANRPEMIFLSSTLLKQHVGKLPDKARDHLYITFPYGLTQVRVPPLYFVDAKRRVKAPTDERRIMSRAHSLSNILIETLMMMRGDFYRDRFLELIDMFQDKTKGFSDYERLSFGPGQRYAAKGCYIMQLTRGADPKLVKKSDWVIH